MIIDFYPEVKGQPMICILQLNETQLAEKNMRIQLPAYLEIQEEITDKPQFAPQALARSVLTTNGTHGEEEK